MSYSNVFVNYEHLQAVNTSLVLYLTFMAILGRYKQFHRILDRTVRLSHFPYLDKFLRLFLKVYIFKIDRYIASWLLWMIVIMTILFCLMKCFH